MQGKTWFKVAVAIWILSLLGGVIALAKGVHIVSVVEAVGPLWMLLGMFSGSRIARHFPNQRSEIAFGVAILATAVGVGSIYYYSTEHVALTLMTVGIFWNMAAEIVSGRNHDSLLNKSIGDIYGFFRVGGRIPTSSIERVLSNGGMILMLSAVVSLFTITTW